MRPIVIDWPAQTTNTVVNASAIVDDVPFVFETITYIPNTQNIRETWLSEISDSPPEGQIPGFAMPENTVRNLFITTSGTSGTVEYRILGYDVDNNLISLGVVPAASTTMQTTSKWSKIIGIVPSESSAGTVSFGIGNAGYTYLVPTDQYNKANNYSLAYSNIVGTVGLTPQFTISPVQSIVYGQQEIIASPQIAPSLYYNFPFANENIVTSPTGLTAPISANAVISTINIPLTGLLTLVSGTTGSFTQTILQQGAAY